MLTSHITIIVTTFNRAHLIEETLDSIINQTYTNWKCIIIDDNSDDNTAQVVSKYLKTDKRFQYYIKKNQYVKGLSASRNMGMDLIDKTDFIQFFDDDDIMHPQKLEIQLAEFKKYNNLDITIFPTINFKDGEKLNIKFVDTKITSNLINIAEDFFLANTLFTAQVPLIRYNYIKDSRFNESLFYAEEWELFNKLFFTTNTKASYVNTPLYFHRKHDLSITTNLYGESNVKAVSKNQAFINVYNVVKRSSLFNGRMFSKFITFALNYHNDNFVLLNNIKNDLRNGLFSNSFKNKLILFLIPYAKRNKRVVTKIIHRVARW